MASGGARSRSGPAPDPDALRRDRASDAAGWITLPGERTDAAPEWPLEAQTQREEALWELEWRRPQAHEWARLGLELEVALYVRAFTEAEVPDASGKVRDYVRMSRENLGLSVPGLARHRWRIAGTPASASSTSETPRPTAPRSSGSRARFKVVPPPEDTD
jgi:hypothetical protein